MSNPFERAKNVDSAKDTQSRANDFQLNKVFDEINNLTRAVTGELAERAAKNLQNAQKDLPSLELEDRTKFEKPAASPTGSPKGATNSMRQDCIEIKGPGGVTDCFARQLLKH